MQVKWLRMIHPPQVGQVQNPHVALPGPHLFLRDIRQITFPCARASQMVVSKGLATPGTKTAVMFVSGQGSSREGLPVIDFPVKSGCEFYLINEKLYRRLSWTDLGVRGKECGLKVHRDGKLVYYALEVEITDAIKAALGEAL